MPIPCTIIIFITVCTQVLTFAYKSYTCKLILHIYIYIFWGVGRRSPEPDPSIAAFVSATALLFGVLTSGCYWMEQVLVAPPPTAIEATRGPRAQVVPTARRRQRVRHENLAAVNAH